MGHQKDACRRNISIIWPVQNNGDKSDCRIRNYYVCSFLLYSLENKPAPYILRVEWRTTKFFILHAKHKANLIGTTFQDFIQKLVDIHPYSEESEITDHYSQTFTKDFAPTTFTILAFYWFTLLTLFEFFKNQNKMFENL